MLVLLYLIIISYIYLVPIPVPVSPPVPILPIAIQSVADNEAVIFFFLKKFRLLLIF